VSYGARVPGPLAGQPRSPTVGARPYCLTTRRLDLDAVRYGGRGINLVNLFDNIYFWKIEEKIF
jgi:hypothetical protein